MMKTRVAAGVAAVLMMLLGVTAVSVAPAAAAGPVLSWAPPSGWQSYPEKKVTSTTALTTVDGGGKDVRITLPAKPVGPIAIQNCRNAVLIGGSIKVLPSSQVNGYDQRAIYVKGCTGTVHIEGVLIDGNVAGSEADGIAVNAPKALVQMQNVRAVGLRGSYSGNHADVFQPWGGVREFRIDRMTGSTNYQGLTVKPASNSIGKGTIRNANVFSSEVTPIDKGGYFYWMNCDEYPLTLDNVYVSPRTGRSYGQSVWPNATHSSCAPTISGGAASWPKSPQTVGKVLQGLPSGGDYVPAKAVGTGYVSPGYR
jgi:hypothetical protein